MTYDPNNPNDPVRRVDPDARRLDTEQRLQHGEPTKKAGSSTPWLVLIGLLVVAGLIWMQVGTSPSDTSTTNAPAPTTSNETTTQTTPPPAATPPAADPTVPDGPATTTPPPATTTTPPPASDAPAPTGGTTTTP
jgi:cytoskeletal protein RodZ